MPFGGAFTVPHSVSIARAPNEQVFGFYFSDEFWEVPHK